MLVYVYMMTCQMCKYVVHVVRGTWYVVRGTWYVARGTWYVARGTWYVVRGTWYAGSFVEKVRERKSLGRNVKKNRLYK